MTDLIGFHPVERDYLISTSVEAESPQIETARFHPVERDYLISTCHRDHRRGRTIRGGFHPVERDYLISTAPFG